jgi:Polyketide cyclase / dehydrase and lipid transport
MVKIEGSTVIARPVEDVFDFVADERNEPKYNPRMIRAEKATPGPIGKGTRWLATIESRGRPLDMTMEVTDYTRPTRIGTLTSMSTAEIRGSVTFKPDPAGTKMRWSWELRPKGVFRLMGPIIARIGRRQEAEIWAGLKRHLEARNHTTPAAISSSFLLGAVSSVSLADPALPDQIARNLLG